MKDYTTAAHVASQLGRTLTSAQQTYLTEHVLPATEEWIDNATGRSWGENAVTSEVLYMSTPYAFLARYPVVSVSAVRGYLFGQSESDIATINSQYYRLTNPITGQLYLPSWAAYKHLEVDYIPDNTIPSRVRLAATMVACVFMRTVLHPETEWLTEYTSGQDLRVKFQTLDIPKRVYDLLGVSDAGRIVVA